MGQLAALFKNSTILTHLESCIDKGLLLFINWCLTCYINYVVQHLYEKMT